jgi:hypothetical protein
MELLEQGVYMFYEFDLTQRLASFTVCFHEGRWNVRRDMQSNFIFWDCFVTEGNEDF